MIEVAQLRKRTYYRALVHQRRDPIADRRERIQIVGHHDHRQAEAPLQAADQPVERRGADRVEAGYVWVNDVEKRWIGVPFGGVKDSGTSTEFSVEELLANTRLKSVSVSLG